MKRMNKVIRHIRIAVLLGALLSLSSCADVASIIIEDTLQDALACSQTHNRTKGNHASDKQKAKMAEQLKQSGKCPTCRGMGRTPDGLYICTTCQGSGKYK